MAKEAEMFKRSRRQAPGWPLPPLPCLCSGLGLLRACPTDFRVARVRRTNYSATRRTQETDIRMALGTMLGDVLAVVLSQGWRVTAAGLTFWGGRRKASAPRSECSGPVCLLYSARHAAKVNPPSGTSNQP